jgi:arylsulfatase A-like enzyme
MSSDLRSLALAALLVSACGSAKPPPASIFVIAVDAASAFYFGAYGDSHGATPEIDRFAREAVLFEQAYSQSATTVSSTASLLTGVRGTTHRMTGRTELSAQLPTLPELLAAQGFATRGFVANPFAGAEKLGFARGYGEMVEVYAVPEVAQKRRLDESVDFVVTLPEDVDEQVFARLPAIHADLASGAPVFAYIHFLQPHKPYDPPEEYLRAFAGAGEPGGWDALHAEFEQANRTGQADPDTIARIEARYRANLRSVDAGIGALLEKLRQAKLYDDSLIVLLADHGDAFFRHRQFGHNTTLYDDMVRIPLMMKLPAREGIAPARIAALVETVDVAATLLDYAGAPLPPELEGESLLPLIRGRTRELAHPEVVMSTQMRDVHALRAGDWKYILHASQGEELYDLRADPREQHDLAAAQPDRTRAMREQLASLVRPGGDRSAGPENRLRDDPRMNELLERLGYVDDRPKPATKEAAPQR